MSAATPVAFGLALEGELPDGVRFNHAAARPRRAVRLMRSDALAEAGPGDATALEAGASDTRPGDGVLPVAGADAAAAPPRAPEAAVAIVAQPDGGHRLSAPGCGACLVAGDGGAIAYAPGSQADGWRRLLVEQALPFAACAAGLECLHASAVALDGRVAALAGVSGAGKSSLALALLRLGAAPIADDVLALEPADDGGLLAHPSLPRLGVRRAEAERVGSAAVAALGAVEPRGEDALLVTLARTAAVAPLPLAALYLIDRRAEPGELAFEPIEDPRLLLACTFNFVLATPARLARLLDLCHRLATRAHLRRAVVPATLDASALAQAIADDVAGVRGDRVASALADGAAGTLAAAAAARSPGARRRQVVP